MIFDELMRGVEVKSTQSLPMDCRLAHLEADGAAQHARSVAFLASLVRAQREGEAAVQALISERLTACGAEVETMRYEPTEIALKEEFASADAMVAGERLAVVGVLRGQGEGRSLLLFGHPDSEDPAKPPPGAGPESWTHDPFEPTQSEGKMFGWGIADDLMGVAAGVCALEACQRDQLLGDVYVASCPSKNHARGATAVLQRVNFGAGWTESSSHLGLSRLHPGPKSSSMRSPKPFRSWSCPVCAPPRDSPLRPYPRPLQDSTRLSISTRPSREPASRKSRRSRVVRYSSAWRWRAVPPSRPPCRHAASTLTGQRAPHRRQTACAVRCHTLLNGICC